MLGSIYRILVLGPAIQPEAFNVWLLKFTAVTTRLQVTVEASRASRCTENSFAFLLKNPCSPA